MSTKNFLIIFGGLPGVGKTTIAKELSKKLGAMYFRVDSVENALKNSTLNIVHAEDAGYEAGYALARDNLRNGLTVIADTVNPIEVTRVAWRNVAKEIGVNFIEVEIVCSDTEQHRRQVETRGPDLFKQELPRWNDVKEREYEYWEPVHLRLDTSAKKVEECLADILSLLKIKV